MLSFGPKWSLSKTHHNYSLFALETISLAILHNYAKLVRPALVKTCDPLSYSTLPRAQMSLWQLRKAGRRRWLRCLHLSFFSFPRSLVQGLTLNHQSLKCHSHFMLASMQKTKHLRRLELNLCMAILFILIAPTCAQ